jgi:diadenosine tetraphosphate (Ap4A) HIT family hydrolase
MISSNVCELCSQPGGEVVCRHEKFRVVLVDDLQYPGFCRVIWNLHVKEMTDLPAPDRILFMTAVWQIEAAVREAMRPDKMNIASFGNIVPHLHWHVIPRYLQDAHFPGPIWAQMQRTPASSGLESRRALLPLLRTSIATHTGQAL